MKKNSTGLDFIGFDIAKNISCYPYPETGLVTLGHLFNVSWGIFYKIVYSTFLTTTIVRAHTEMWNRNMWNIMEWFPIR